MDINTLQSIKYRFIQELTSGKQSQKTCLPFIRHQLSEHSITCVDELFQVMVVGGSFYQKALMKKTNKGIEMISHQEGSQPPFLSEQALMDFLSEHIDPQVKTVALNFAYPMTPINRDGRLDGRLVSGSKENTFEGLVGQMVGERIEYFFEKNLNRQIMVSAANDTICLLLSGLMNQSWNNLAAGIVGTGLNFALFLDEFTTINLEAAEFDKFEQSEAGKIIDKASVAPGSALIEKEVSGAYLYHHFNIAAEKLNFAIDKITSTKEIDDYAKNENHELSELAQNTLHHSAAFTAILIAGILEFCDRDLTFIMQGSLFWKGYRYKETVDEIVKKLAPNHHASYKQIKHSDLYGAAKLVG